MKFKLAPSDRNGVSRSAFIAVYRSQAECFGGSCDGKLGVACEESRIFKCLYVPETIEWE
jgi:hypothetical protein